MSKYEYSNIFSRLLEAIVFITLQIFFELGNWGIENWGISLGYSPVLAGGSSVT